MNNNLKLYNVAPSVPSELRFLEELSYNMWWCYHPSAQELFERIDPVLWQEVEGNTRLFMSRLPQGKLEELARDPLYVKEKEKKKNYCSFATVFLQCKSISSF